MIKSKKSERSLIVVKSEISDRAKKKNWNKLIKNIKSALGEYNSTTEEKLMANLEYDYIPMTMKNEDGSVKIIGRLY